jgi:hypothetical protein
MRASDWFSFVVLPDTQIYTRSHPELFAAQTEWIARERERLRIAFVLHAGDITDSNEPSQWEVARSAFAHLDGKVPYVLAIGNHDMGPNGWSDDRTTLLHATFSFGDHEKRARTLSAFEPGSLANTAQLFDTPAGPWLAFGLEFGPRPDVVAWAREVGARHRGVPAVLVTHAYLYDDGTRYHFAARGDDQKWAVQCYGIGTDGAHDAEMLWDGWLKHYPELEMVVSGHVLGRGVARLSSQRDDGSVLHQLLANYQHTRAGGGAFLRIVEVHPDRFQVRTYSPHYQEEKLDDDNHFALPRSSTTPAA